MSQQDDSAKHLRIDYVEIPVTDIGAAKRFYGQVFGWKFQDWGPDYASFDDGQLEGGFRKESEVKAGGVLVIMYSTELEATRSAVIGANGRLVRDIFEFPGGRRFHFADPSGNELAVWSKR